MNLFTKQKQTHRCRKQTYGYQRGKGGNKLGVWDLYIYIYMYTRTHTHIYIYKYTIYKIDNQQGPTVQHTELYSIFCNKL